jgi:putative glutamine amidotransferase
MSGDPAIPTIGITLSPRIGSLEQQRRAPRVAQAYRRPLEAHGARLVELAPSEVTPALDGLDGLLLTGGGDIAPDLYGQAAHPRLSEVNRVRDEFEVSLVKAALAKGLAVLGICRGAQVLGVALGGELIQDIASQVEDAELHQSATKAPARHRVRIADGSLLARIAETRFMLVNSFHHQSNGRLGGGMQPVAWSQDGVVEAIELPGAGFVIGVQWHPERMWRRAPRQTRLFAAFVSAAAAKHKGIEG